MGSDPLPFASIGNTGTEPVEGFEELVPREEDCRAVNDRRGHDNDDRVLQVCNTTTQE